MPCANALFLLCTMRLFGFFFPNKLIMNFSKKLLRSGVRKSEAFTESCSLIKCIAHGIAFKNV